MENQIERAIFEIKGEDTLSFLQGLITNEIKNLDKGLIYTAMLTPQGKYFADFFIAQHAGRIFIDCSSVISNELKKKLTLYRLRAKVEVLESNLKVSFGIGKFPDNAYKDPRHRALGWRLYGEDRVNHIQSSVNWVDIKVKHCIPETGVELLPNQTYILEAGFERLNGVDFKKGCYVGQEIIARMKHKADLRKGLKTVKIEGSVEIGTKIICHDKEVGTLYSQSNGLGIAFLRFDRVDKIMKAGSANVIFEN